MRLPGCVTRRLVVAFACAVLAALSGGCGDDDAPGPPDAGGGFDPALRVDDWCPGHPHCTGAGDGQLLAGAGKADITPDLSKYETQWTDANGDTCYSKSRGDTFVDENGNGKFDAIWIAGFCGGRPATGVHDPLEVRALALRWNDVTIVIAYADLIGLFIDEFERIQADPRVAALDVDLFVFGSTHQHEGPDTVGIWGDNPLRSGVDPDYMAFMRERFADAVVAAVGDLRPARMLVAQRLAVDPVTMVAERYIGDAREPMILDPTLTVARFVEAGSLTTIGTLVNFAGHPEFTGSRNNLLTADFPHWLREVIENGLADEGLAGVGGITVYVQGPLGGQIGPKNTFPIGPDGMPITEYGNLLKAEVEGKQLGRMALEMLADSPEEVAAPELSFRTGELFARIDNVGYQAFGLTGVLDRQLFGYDPNRAVEGDNIPWVRSRESVVRIGPIAFVTAPGELHPELFVGGYDGSWSWGQEMVTNLPNSPNLALAPQPPYLRDLLLDQSLNPGAKYVFCAGAAHDFLGYIVPEFNYVLHPTNPYIEEADGHHYEETNSVGPEVERHLQHPMMELAKWRPPAM